MVGEKKAEDEDEVEDESEGEDEADEDAEQDEAQDDRTTARGSAVGTAETVWWRKWSLAQEPGLGKDKERPPPLRLILVFNPVPVLGFAGEGEGDLAGATVVVDPVVVVVDVAAGRSGRGCSKPEENDAVADKERSGGGGGGEKRFESADMAFLARLEVLFFRSLFISGLRKIL